MKNLRNFTGDDLIKAEADMNSAWSFYDNAKKTYEYSVNQGHASYARRVRKPEMDNAYEQYTRAKQSYDDILKSISDANNINFQAAQQNYVADALQSQTDTGTTSPTKNYNTLIYIAIALVIAYFILK